jgi:hypothetical protein
MTTLSLPANVRSITLEDGRTFVLDGKVPTPTAKAAVASTPSVQRTPKAPRSKARKALTGEALAKQVAFWSGPASKGQIARLKEAGTKKRDKTLATMSSLDARAELAALKPDAKVAVIPAEVLAALKA